MQRGKKNCLGQGKRLPTSRYQFRSCAEYEVIAISKEKKKLHDNRMGVGLAEWGRGALRERPFS